jgi:hypothetical protein
VVIDAERRHVAPFARQYVWDNNPLSPSYAGPGSGASATPPDPNDAGPMRHRPFFYNSSLLANVTQARAAGATLLAKMSGLNSQLNVSSVPNTALDDGDTIRVTLPRERWDRTRVTGRHIIDSFPVPLIWHRTPMQISTRSTVADLAES